MSHGAAEQSVIDIDEFERRLRGPATRGSSDPLAELARLITPSDSKPDSLDALFARPRRAEPEQLASPDVEALRGPVWDDSHSDDTSYAAVGQDGRHDLSDVDAAWSAGEEHERFVPVEAIPARSRRPLYATAAVIAVGLLGIGTTFAYKGRSAGTGELVEVKAAPGPTKVQGPSDNKNAVAESTVLDRGSAAQPVTRVVDRQERPVDLKDAARAAPRMVSTTPTASAQMANLVSAVSNDSGNSNFAEPRKVKTVSVRPDGTLVGGQTGDAAPPSPPAAQTAAPQSKNATPKMATRAVTTPKPPVAEKAELTVSTKPAASTKDVVAKPVTPKPVATKPTPTKVARAVTADDGADTDAAASSPASRTVASSGGGGGFTVQLAAPGSETEARSIASRLGQKFSGELGGSRVSVQKAADKDVYRVRTASMSRESAVATCEKIKASGGACFVAKN